MANLWSATVCGQEASHFDFEMKHLGICEFKAGRHGNLVPCEDFHLENPLPEDLPWCSSFTTGGTSLNSTQSPPWADGVSERRKVWSPY